MGIPMSHIKIGRVVGENEEGITIFFKIMGRD